jgi:hypothetical protein
VTQEFQLSITPVGPDTYLLRTEAVATGVPLAEAQVTWPLDDWLAQAQTLFQDPLAALLSSPGDAQGLDQDRDQDRDRIRPDSPWTQLGQALYQGLFQGRIRDSWVAAQGVAQNRRQPLRLRLGFKDSRIQRLPWELLYGDDRPLATGLDVTLCRYYQSQTVTDLATQVPLAPASVPIRVLVVMASPSNQAQLALRQEIQTLVQTLQAKPAGPGPIPLDLTLLEQPGRPELVQALEQGNFQVLHYAGHSEAYASHSETDETGGSLLLVNRQSGLAETLSGGDLAGLLVNNGIRLAVFNSCRGAYTPQDDAQANWLDQNLVQALVNRGLPGVIAMAERIPDDVALTFTQLLYRNLHQGHPIDLCLSRVRQGLMSAYGSDQPFWVLPLLYLRPDFDGYLYRGDGQKLALEGDRPTLGHLNGADLGDDDLSEVALLLPDYSTDPDISGLAAEMLTRQAADLPSDGAADPLYAWLQEGDQPEAEASTAHVANLVQQLSQPVTTSTQPPLTADPSENLLPQPEPLHPALPGLPAPPADFADPTPAPAKTLKPQPRWLGWPVPSNILLRGSLGLAGLGAVLGLALLILPAINRSTPPALPTATETPVSGSAGATQPSTDLLSSAINAIALERTASARTLIEQLLDRNDLTTAAAALSTLTAPQKQDPDMAYVLGRLAWQQIVADPTVSTTPSDALRSWIDATQGNPDLVEAWVGLGFAHYALGDYGEAIRVWERAIAIDQGQRRDINPSAPQMANPITIHAYAGLAMAYQQEANITIVAEERAPFEQQAQRYYRQTLALDPTMVNPNTLALHWLWLPTLNNDWQTTLRQLALSDGNPTIEGN